MSDHSTESRIQAMLDGELTADQAGQVRDHCDECALCGAVRDAITSVSLRMRADSDEAPLRPVWPHVERRLHRGLPQFDLPFALGTGAAVATGLVLGMFLGMSPATTGSGMSDAGGDVRVAETSTDLWSALGSSLFAGGGSSLSDVYGLSSVEQSTENEDSSGSNGREGAS